jgi:hypothetical protein
MSYYLSRYGRSLGPYSEHELRTMVASGQAELNDPVCVAGENQWRPLESLPSSASAPMPQEGSAGIATIIPYKNPPALTAYYLGVFSLIPCFGLLLAIPAFILGIIGLRKARENPGSKGKAHAWNRHHSRRADDFALGRAVYLWVGVQPPTLARPAAVPMSTALLLVPVQLFLHLLIALAPRCFL